MQGFLKLAYDNIEVIGTRSVHCLSMRQAIADQFRMPYLSAQGILLTPLKKFHSPFHL